MPSSTSVEDQDKPELLGTVRQQVPASGICKSFFFGLITCAPQDRGQHSCTMGLQAILKSVGQSTGISNGCATAPCTTRASALGCLEISALHLGACSVPECTPHLGRDSALSRQSLAWRQIGRSHSLFLAASSTPPANFERSILFKVCLITCSRLWCSSAARAGIEVAAAEQCSLCDGRLDPQPNVE